MLFGDLVGFTSLAESRDQEEVRELLSRYFEECSRIVARYGGVVEKFIGDAVMAVWGVPTAHEDDAERAVRAGLELVNRVESLGADLHVPDLAMRVGIVTGEVAVTIGAEQQGMVAGDAVNTAARVQTAASPGQVWVDETTRLLTTSAISYVDVGSHAMKGKADPMPLWSVRAVVAAVGGAQRADGLEAPHIGRERDLRLVKELFHGVEESGRPALLVVDGEPGVGKTRLGWEFEKYSDGLSAPVRWHSGRCLSYGEGVAFFALAEAIRGRLQLLGDDDAEQDVVEDQGQLLELGLDRYVPDLAERTWLRPRLGALLGIGAVATFPREDLFSAWSTFLHRVSEDARTRWCSSSTTRSTPTTGSCCSWSTSWRSAPSPASCCCWRAPDWSRRTPSWRPTGARPCCTSSRCRRARWACSSTAWCTGFPTGSGTAWWRGPRGSRCSRSRRCAP